MNLFIKAHEIYQRNLETDKAAHEALRSVGVVNGELAKSLGLGFTSADSFRNTLNENEVRGAAKCGLLSTKFKERMENSLSFPVFRDRELCGFLLWDTRQSRKGVSGQSKDIFLNEEVFDSEKEIILTNSPVTYLQLRQCGYSNVVCLPYTGHAEFFFKCLRGSGVTKVFVTARKHSDEILKVLKNIEADQYLMALDRKNILNREYVESALQSATKIKSERIERPRNKVTISTESSERQEDKFKIVLGEITYHIQSPQLRAASLKVVLTAMRDDERYTDKVDLYIASSRRAFAKACAERFLEDATLFEADLHKLIVELENIRDSKKTAEITHAQPTVAEEEEALKALQGPNILDEFVTDMRATGFVGEELNLKLGFLMSISRLLDKPLSVIVQSSSGTGKSFLLNAICAVTPPESLVFMSKLTPSSLYYMPDLRHKLLCVDEAHGSEGSLYPLRTLQSNHKLVLALPIKDSATGTTVTKQILVQGPVSFVESTTSDNLHPENASRAIILKMDESAEQLFQGFTLCHGIS